MAEDRDPTASEPTVGSEPTSASPGSSLRTSAFADLHLRTHELELLISAAVLFVLVRLPGFLDSRADRWLGQLSDSLYLVGQFVFQFAAAMTWALVLTFFVHLVLRAFWVGLLGLESAYPDGIRWDAIETHGPFQRRFYQRFLPSLSELIDGLDRVCSVLFSLAFLLVITLALGFVWATLGGFVALGLGGRSAAMKVLLLFALVISAPSLLLGLVDTILARRFPGLAENRRLTRWIEAILTFYGTIFFVKLWSPILLTLQSRVRRKSSWPFLTGFFVTMMVLSMVPTATFLARKGALRIDGYAFFPPRPTVGSVDTRYYEDQRKDLPVSERSPTISSDLIDEPYLRLFLPYVPRYDEKDLATLCPETAPLQRTGLRLWRSRDAAPDQEATAAARDCLARLWEIALDGSPIAPDLRFAYQRDSGRRGLVAYLPVAGLVPGPHGLTVTRKAIQEDDEETIHPITFWK